eukprot:IDg14891t1
MVHRCELAPRLSMPKRCSFFSLFQSALSVIALTLRRLHRPADDLLVTAVERSAVTINEKCRLRYSILNVLCAMCLLVHRPCIKRAAQHWEMRASAPDQAERRNGYSCVPAPPR